MRSISDPLGGFRTFRSISTQSGCLCGASWDSPKSSCPVCVLNAERATEIRTLTDQLAEARAMASPRMQAAELDALCLVMRKHGVRRCGEVELFPEEVAQ